MCDLLAGEHEGVLRLLAQPEKYEGFQLIVQAEERRPIILRATTLAVGLCVGLFHLAQRSTRSLRKILDLGKIGCKRKDR